MVTSAQFGPYDLTERISVGGMAEVFRATHRDSGRVVALKRILPSVSADEEFIELFHDEALIARQLEHPNIARIYDVGQVNGNHYIALEHIQGRPLRTLIDRAHSRGERLPMEIGAHIMAEVAQGLDYAHVRKNPHGQPLGIVHRDVSPQNILISYGGEVKLIDFGIAKAAGKLTRTQAGSIKGKMGYMSPEQVRGEGIDRRSDVFALGICLWEVLTLERLFDAPNELLMIEKIRSGEIVPPSAANPLVPAELDRIVLKALAKNVDARYASASDFQADLRAYLRSQGVAVDAARVASFMARLFPEAATGRAEIQGYQESNRMSDKGGSDLDVFDGLAKRRPPVRAARLPPAAPPRLPPRARRPCWA